MTTDHHHQQPQQQVLLGAHWNRFVAWCAATGQTPLPAAPAAIEQFLTAFPAASSTQRLRRSSIRAHHLAAGYPDPLPVVQARVWPHQPTADSEAVRAVLAAIPKYRYPVGLRGRRDAFLIVLLGVLDLTRAQARTVTADDVAVTSVVRIGGKVVPSADDPAGCAACAVTRWLRIVGPAWTGFRGDVIRLLDPTRGTLDQHDCEQPLPGEWRRAEQLLMPFDVHGWARPGVSLSARSMTSIIPKRRAAAAGEVLPERVGKVTRTPTRFDALTVQETYAAFGDTDAAVDAALTRLQAVWDAARTLGDDLHDATHGRDVSAVRVDGPDSDRVVRGPAGRGPVTAQRGR